MSPKKKKTHQDVCSSMIIDLALYFPATVWKVITFIRLQITPTNNSCRREITKNQRAERWRNLRCNTPLTCRGRGECRLYSNRLTCSILVAETPGPNFFQWWIQRADIFFSNDLDDILQRTHQIYWFDGCLHFCSGVIHVASWTEILYSLSTWPKRL